MVRILVAEDDKSTRTLMCAVLNRAGFETIGASNGEAALGTLDKEHIDLLITDVMMPGLDGFELTRELREARFSLPILMVTAKHLPKDRRQGFIVGTDDYLVKPVDAQEMVLRVKALLRRARIVADRRIVIGNAVLDYDALSVSRPGESHDLPPKEFSLLYKLLAYPDQVFTRFQLLEDIWGDDVENDGNTLNVHISRLRTRFKDWPEFDIVTVRGLGYKAVKHEPED